MTAITLAVLVHIGLFFVLQSTFTMPIIPPKQKPIEVQIISFTPEPVQEVEPEPALIPYKPAPARAPKPKLRPKPRPKPKPKPAIVPKPEPTPEPKPVIEPEPIIIPPATEVLVSETVEAIQEVSPQPVPIPDPIPQPVIEIFEPIPEPIPEIIQPPIPQPTIEIFEPLPEPVIEPIIEPIVEPLPELEPILDPIPEPLPEPEIEPLSDLPTTPTESELPVAGAVVEDEIIIETPEPIAPIIQDVIEPIVQKPVTLPEPEPEPEILREPELEIIEAAPIITTAPTILASPDAPKTQSEQDTSVPQSQASSLDLILENAKKSGRRPQARPNTGGGNTGTLTIGNAPSSGVTRRANPGSTGWTLAPGSYGDKTTEGYKNMMLDIRCRETTRTHEDCPSYIPKHKGRNAEGFESFNAHEPRGTSTTANERRRGMNMGSSIFEGGTYGGPSAAKNARGTGGNSDDTSGGPSTSVLDDVYLPNYDLSIPVPGGRSSGGRLRDVFGNSQPAPWTQQPILPPPLEEEEEDEFAPVEIIKPKR